VQYVTTVVGVLEYVFLTAFAIDAIIWIVNPGLARRYSRIRGLPDKLQSDVWMRIAGVFFLAVSVFLAVIFTWFSVG
jgi:hypothetical protein